MIQIFNFLDRSKYLRADFYENVCIYFAALNYFPELGDLFLKPSINNIAFNTDNLKCMFSEMID